MRSLQLTTAIATGPSLLAVRLCGNKTSMPGLVFRSRR
jgi:hypothetical protein